MLTLPYCRQELIVLLRKLKGVEHRSLLPNFKQRYLRRKAVKAFCKKDSSRKEAT